MSETAAAERLRRIRAGENFAAVYGIENQVRERATFVDPRVLELHHADEQTVIAEYLTLVRPDDATPLNTAAAFDWLDKLKPATGDLSMLCVRMYADGLHLVVNDYVCPSVATKGVVRSLLASVLGIPLTGDVR